MKKYIVLIVSLVLVWGLAACGTEPQSASTEQPAAQPEAQGTPQPGNFERTMPLSMKLALGTFKLEDTDYPIDAEQAQELLPLWKAARSLNESDTTATEEIDAIINQIEEAMTPEQLEAIDAMNLTFQDMATIAEEQGIELGFGGGNLTPEMQATREAMRASGQMPGGGSGGGSGGGFGGGFGGDMPPGGFPEGGPGGGAGGGFSPEAQQTAIAERGAARGASLGLNSALLDAIIEFLEAKI